ncbi:hypothetical protein ACFPH6_01015 [Streptomyces xiangluensis]|uniref:Uncharacterized protein n=1 Tax=Streptomyces xiangluensis TaxID=2665720 RepID=A0ABV8YF93_9ACTN
MAEKRRSLLICSPQLLVPQARDASVRSEGAQVHVHGDLPAADEVPDVVDRLHRGVRVREFTVHELLNLYEVRTILKVEATRKGSVSVTGDDLDKMHV